VSHSRSRKRSDSIVLKIWISFWTRLHAAHEETGHDHLLVNINPTPALIHDSHSCSPFVSMCSSMKRARWGYQQTKKVLCVLLLCESDMWWCLKVSRSVLCSGQARSISGFDLSPDTRCMQYTLFFPDATARITEAESLFICGGAPTVHGVVV
jgi:hypothetical protein